MSSVRLKRVTVCYFKQRLSTFYHKIMFDGKNPVISHTKAKIQIRAVKIRFLRKCSDIIYETSLAARDYIMENIIISSLGRSELVPNYINNADMENIPRSNENTISACVRDNKLRLVSESYFQLSSFKVLSWKTLWKLIKTLILNKRNSSSVLIRLFGIWF